MNALFAHKLEDWYRENMRSLPWRETKDPYRIWVSEIILQQTRVVQGMDYYHRFIHRFPDVQSLASSSEDEVLRLWQGLGYYSRARNMHKAARQVMDRGGRFPDTYEEVRSLAGIGDYTAAAIMSFAYDEPYAVLDGNVFRVLSRIYGIDTPIDSSEGKKVFSTLSQELLDEHQPSLYNQAIMDFGAVQCTPKGTNCESCPFVTECSARREGRVDELPVKGHKIAVKTRHLIYINVYEMHGEHMLVHRRKKGDIWEGLYELPLIEDFTETKDAFPSSPWLEAMVCDGGTLRQLALGVKHQLTHQLLLTDYYEMSVPFNLHQWLDSHPAIVSLNSFQVVTQEEREQLGMPRLVLQLLSLK